MLIESPQNPRVKSWKKLQTAAGRRESGQFLAEGPHLVDEAMNSGILIRTLLIEEGHDPDHELRSAAEEVVGVSARVMRAVCEAQNPQWVAGICSFPEPEPEPEREGLVVLLDAVQDPGNVGALIRAADAAGAREVWVGRGTADVWSPRALRAAQGSTFHLQIREADAREALEGARGAGMTIYGTRAIQGNSVFDAKPPGNFVVVFGNEAAGIAPELEELCGQHLSIPMFGRAESLGVAAAGAVVLMTLARNASLEKTE